MLRDALDQAAPSELWNSSLEAVIERACDHAPDRRWPAASAMAMALRAASGPLPTSVHVSAFVRDAFGGRIRARRAALEMQAARPFALAGVAQPRSSSVAPPHPSTDPSARRLDEPKVQIAPAVLDAPTVPALRSNDPTNIHARTEVSIENVLNDDVYRRRLPTIRIANAPASRWRLTDARGIVTAVAILVAFAIGCFLGGRAWFESGHPPTPASPTSPVVPRPP
jgi:hypothetical protein